jgi:hypothetical protein
MTVAVAIIAAVFGFCWSAVAGWVQQLGGQIHR